YHNNVKVYKCPADYTCVNSNLKGNIKVRSYSMNCWMNPDRSDNWNYAGGNYPDGSAHHQIAYTKMTAIRTPAERWVFLDENPYSINDGMFVCDIANLHSW